MCMYTREVYNFFFNNHQIKDYLLFLLYPGATPDNNVCHGRRNVNFVPPLFHPIPTSDQNIYVLPHVIVCRE